MLDEEHRDVEKMRETFALIRRVAHGVTKDVWHKGVVVGQEIEYQSAWMDMYLARVLGPVKDLVTEEDLSELSDQALAEIRTKLRLVK